MPLLLSMVAAGKLQPEKLVERILSTVPDDAVCFGSGFILHCMLYYTFYLLYRL